MERLDAAPIKQMVVTDSIPIPADRERDYIKVLTVSRLLGEAILRIHHAESVSKLFEIDPEE